MLETANYNSYGLWVMPVDPQVRAAWLDEADVAEVEAWIDSLGSRNAYVVFSRSMAAYATYFDAPYGYTQLASAVRSSPGWSVVYRNADTTIYQVHAG